jgi:chromosome partitioning protein
MSQKFDDTIVDVGGRDTITLRKALLVADVVGVPFIPSQLDVWGLDRMNEIIGDAKSVNENLRAFSVMNKADANPKILLKDEALAIAKELAHIKFTGLALGYRVSYRRSIADGIAVTELAGSKKDSKATAEMTALYREVFKDA